MNPIAIAPASPPPVQHLRNEKAYRAAQDFESVFLGRMFEQMFTGTGGEGPLGGSGESGIWRSFLTDAYARNVAQQGGIGIANHVYRSLLQLQNIQPQDIQPQAIQPQAIHSLASERNPS